MGWYVWMEEAGDVEGPFSTSRIVRALQVGALPAETLVARPGDEQWAAVYDVPEIVAGLLVIPESQRAEMAYFAEALRVSTTWKSFRRSIRLLVEGTFALYTRSVRRLEQAAAAIVARVRQRRGTSEAARRRALSARLAILEARVNELEASFEAPPVLRLVEAPGQPAARGKRSFVRRAAAA